MAVVKEQIKEDEKLLLSVREVSNMLGISEKSVRNFAYEMNMQVRIGKRVLIHRKKLECHFGCCFKNKVGKKQSKRWIYLAHYRIWKDNDQL